MDALAELQKKKIIDRTALDQAVIFSRHGEVQQAATELAALREVAEKAQAVSDAFVKRGRLYNCLIALQDALNKLPKN